MSASGTEINPALLAKVPAYGRVVRGTSPCASSVVANPPFAYPVALPSSDPNVEIGIGCPVAHFGTFGTAPHNPPHPWWCCCGGGVQKCAASARTPPSSALPAAHAP